MTLTMRMALEKDDDDDEGDGEGDGNKDDVKGEKDKKHGATHRSPDTCRDPYFVAPLVKLVKA